MIDVESTGKSAGELALAEIIVARACDFSLNNQTYTGISHLGNILKSGDVVMGYDLTTGNFNNSDFDELVTYGKFQLPDIILVKKSYKILANLAKRIEFGSLKH